MYRFILLNPALGRKVLRHDPVGWDAQRYTFKRSPSYHGITLEYSQQLEFIKDGRTYLQTVYEAEGVEGVVEVIIEEQDLNLRWVPVFAGVVNFEKYEITATRVKTNIQQTGFTRRFVNGDDLEIDLGSLTGAKGEPLTPFSNEGGLSIELHSKTIRKAYEAGITPEQPYTESAPITDSTVRDSILMVGWDKLQVNELGAYTYGTGFGNQLGEIFPEATESGPLTISIRLKATVTLRIQDENGDFDKYTVEFFYRKNNNPPALLMQRKGGAPGGAVQVPVDISFSITEQQVPGDRFYFWGRVIAEDVSSFGYDFRYGVEFDKAVSFIKAYAYTQTGATPCRGLLVHEAGARLVQAITGVPDAFVSSFLGRTDSEPRRYPADGPGSLLFMASGYQIRNFPAGQKPVTVTYKKFYEGLNALYNLGTGIELIEGRERVRIEGRGYFYRGDLTVLELGGVSNLRKSLAPEHIHNAAEFGYLKWQTETPNGLDEFNSKRTFNLPITQVKRKYSALCPFIAGGYSIETIRREQYNLAAIKDNSNDNEVHVICVLRDGPVFVTERAQAYTIIENVVSPDTVYNARISPARMLLNHGGNLKAGLLHQLNDYVRFATGEGNFTMASQMLQEAVILAENADYLIAELPDPPFMPEVYEFEYGLRAHEIKLIRENPYGLIKFRDASGNVKAGFLQELKASTAEPSTFKLLRKYE